LKQPERTEFFIGDKDLPFGVISAEKNGLILYREANLYTSEARSSLNLIEIYMLDTMLNQKWRITHSFSPGHEFIGYDYDDGRFFMLFSDGQYKSSNYVLSTLDLESRKITEVKISKIVPIELTDFRVMDHVAVFTGNVGFRPAILHYNFNTEQIKVLPWIYNTLQNSIVDVNLNDQFRTITVIMNEKTFKKNRTFAIKNYDIEGELVYQTRLEPGKNYSLLDGKPTQFADGRQLIAGTYTHKRSKYSRGMFIAKLTPDGKQEIRYYNYANFKNFFKYMREKRQERIRNRIERRKEKGKKLRFSYKLMLHEIIEKDDKYIAIGEAYYPRFSSSSPYFSSFYRYGYGGYRSYYDTNFEGFRYTHAVVIGFNDQGKILWDNVFAINDVVTFELEQFVNISVVDDRIVLLYNNDENIIQSKIIQNDEVIDGKKEYEIELIHEADEIKKNYEEISGLKSWYGNTFFTYGMQKIKRERQDGPNATRDVFYINKITYR